MDRDVVLCAFCRRDLDPEACRWIDPETGEDAHRRDGGVPFHVDCSEDWRIVNGTA